MVDNRLLNKLIDKYKRYQSGLSMGAMFPQKNKKICACGCGKKLSGRQRRWASKACNKAAYRFFAVVKGDGRVIRYLLSKRDCGVCSNCGIKSKDWQADHIIPVHKGGGGCNIDNFQTLCVECHKEKTKKDLNK